jgi:hypothetical protein
MAEVKVDVSAPQHLILRKHQQKGKPKGNRKDKTV